LGYIEEYLFKTISPPEETAAVFVECLQADSGEVVPPPDFMPKLRKLCDRHNLLLVIDDIKIGLGRTGAMFSYQHFGVEPDVLVLGKSLGGGLPLSAVIGPSDILDSASSFAGSTNSGNATCCAAGLATVEQVESKNIPRRAYRNGKYLSRRLKQALGRFEIVGDIRGMGMIHGIDLVKDRKTKEPNRDAAAKIVYRAWELGLVCYYAGMFGNIIEITPPMILTRTQIDDGIAILEQAIREYLEGDIPDEAVAPYSGW
jgi:4-aminobutyrate aminotransferase